MLKNLLLKNRGRQFFSPLLAANDLATPLFRHHCSFIGNAASRFQNSGSTRSAITLQLAWRNKMEKALSAILYHTSYTVCLQQRKLYNDVKHCVTCKCYEGRSDVYQQDTNNFSHHTGSVLHYECFLYQTKIINLIINLQIIKFSYFIKFILSYYQVYKYQTHHKFRKTLNVLHQKLRTSHLKKPSPLSEKCPH